MSTGFKSLVIALILLLPIISWAQTVSPSTTPSLSPTPSPSVSLEDEIFAPALPIIHFFGQVWQLLSFWTKTGLCWIANALDRIPYFPTIKSCTQITTPQIPKLPSFRQGQPTYAPGRPIF